MPFNRRETAILLIGDFLILAASLWAALLLRNLALPSFSYFEANVLPFLPIFLLSLVIFYIAGLYEKQTRPIKSVMGIRIFGAQAATVLIAAVLFFVLPLSIAPKTILILYLVISVVSASLWRFYCVNREFRIGQRTGALLIGTGPAAIELYEEVNSNAWYRMRFASFLNTANLDMPITQAIAAARDMGIRTVVIDINDPTVARELSKIYTLMTEDSTFVEFATLYETIFDRVPLEHLNTAQLLESLSQKRATYDAAKRIFDIALAIPLSIVAVPIIAIAAILLALTGGPSFIRAERIGRGGRIIKLLKLRTMLFYDAGDPARQKQNRVTRLGRILRKTRIDELPQLWNVLRGDLSFIGPRPEFPKLVEVYEREVPEYQIRHLIAPGLSGWAQIHDYDVPRGAADVLRTRRKVSYDLYYLKHRSFTLDLAIAIKTLRAVFSFSGT